MDMKKILSRKGFVKIDYNKIWGGVKMKNLLNKKGGILSLIGGIVVILIVVVLFFRIF